MARTMSVHKIRTLDLLQHFLDGGIVGHDLSRGVEGLVGKTLIFTSPSAVTVTFDVADLGAGESRDIYTLLLKDIAAQIAAAIPAVCVKQLDGNRIALVEVTPTNGVALAAGGTAKALLGFTPSAAVTGRLINPPGGSAPSLAHVQFTDNAHVLYVAEV